MKTAVLQQIHLLFCRCTGKTYLLCLRKDEFERPFCTESEQCSCSVTLCQQVFQRIVIDDQLQLSWLCGLYFTNEKAEKRREIRVKINVKK